MENAYYAVLSSKLLKKVFVASTKKGVCEIDFHTTEKDFVRRLKKRFSGKITKDQKRKSVV